MKFKFVNLVDEIIEEVDLNKTANEILTKFIEKYPQYNLSLDPNQTTFTSRGVINQNKENLNKTLIQLKLKQNSIIMIEDKRDVELA